MPRKRQHVPAYRPHKASGQARVIIGGRHIYLGRFGSSESREAYARLIAEMDSPHEGSSGRDEIARDDEPKTINEIILTYWKFAKTYYVKNGKPTKELASMRDALGPLREIHGSTSISDFGPKALKLVRQRMIGLGWSRRVVNKQISRIRRVIKWAVAEELVPPSVYQGLQTVAGLQRGRTTARETEPVKPVEDLHVALVLPFVAPQIATMILIQRLTGMRPGEVVQLRSCDIDTHEDVWIFEPGEHKNDWRGQSRPIPLGPTVQQLLQPFIAHSATEYFFSPREAEAWRFANRPPYSGRTRTTTIYPSETRRREAAKRESKKRIIKRPPGDRYDTDSYRRAIKYGIKRARESGVMVSNWFPNQLRHSLATDIRKEYGVEAAQVLLGHARADVTQVYAERDMDLARRIVKKIG